MSTSPEVVKARLAALRKGLALSALRASLKEVLGPIGGLACSAPRVRLPECDAVALKIAQSFPHSYDQAWETLQSVAGDVALTEQILRSDCACPGARRDMTYFERRRLELGGDLRPGQSVERMDSRLRRDWEQARAAGGDR